MKPWSRRSPNLVPVFVRVSLLLFLGGFSFLALGQDPQNTEQQKTVKRYRPSYNTEDPNLTHVSHSTGQYGKKKGSPNLKSEADANAATRSTPLELGAITQPGTRKEGSEPSSMTEAPASPITSPDQGTQQKSTGRD